MDHRQHLTPGEIFSRHRHQHAYAAVVIAGGSLECGDAGRFSLSVGDIAFHAPFESHNNSISRSGATVINLPVKICYTTPAFAQLNNLSEILRLTGREPLEVTQALLHDALPIPPKQADWPDKLAHDLRTSPNIVLGAWAQDHRLAPGSVSRGFQKTFGITPQRYRYEARARAALDLLLRTTRASAGIAIEVGFADQAHMTRAVQAITGTSPHRWRKLNTFKTGGGR